MPITEQQKVERKKFIGSSDAAAVLGLDQYRTPYDVWADKTGMIEASGLDTGNDAIDIGNWMEEGVLRWFGNKRNLKLILNDDTNRNRKVHQNGVMAANFDALVENDPSQACEAKTHGIVSMYVSEQWGEEGTDEVPERIALQCQHQMAVLPSLRIVHVPVLLGGVGLRSYFVEKNEKLISDMTAVMVQFWNDNVLKQVPPADALPSIETVKKLKRVPEKTVSLPDGLVRDWQVAKDELKRIEDIKKENEILLLAALGDAECGETSFGTITYFKTKPREAYTVPAGPGYRQLRISKPKKGK